MAIVDQRQVQGEHGVLSKCLYNGDGLPIEDATWELLNDVLEAYPHLHFQEKVFLEAGRNDTDILTDH